jgi:hypothetical protein
MGGGNKFMVVTLSTTELPSSILDYETAHTKLEVREMKRNVRRV